MTFSYFLENRPKLFVNNFFLSKWVLITYISVSNTTVSVFDPKTLFVCENGGKMQIGCFHRICIMRLGGFHTRAFHHVTVLILLRGFVREGGNCLTTQQYQNLFRAKMSVRRFVKNSDDMPSAPFPFFSSRGCPEPLESPPSDAAYHN